MSLSDLASLGTFISGMAVVVTLVFLLLQMRQANLNQKSLMQQGRTQRTLGLLMLLTNPQLCEIVTRAFKGDPTLSEAEYVAFYGYAAGIFWNYEDSFLQFEAGTLDATSWASDVSSLRRFCTNPAYRAVWSVVRDSIGEGYRSFVDSLMEEAKGTRPTTVSATLRQRLAEERTKLGLAATEA